MPINTPTGYLDITNATLRGSKIVTTGFVGIANANPTNHLSIGSNLHINDTHSNVLQISGNINAASVVLGGLSIAPTFDLEIVTNTGNTTPYTVEFNNTATAFVTTANATIGDTLTASKLVGDGSGISAIQSSNVTDFGSNVSRITTLESSRALGSDLDNNSARITNLSSNLSDNSSRITVLESGDISISGDKTFTGEIIFESNVHMNGGNVLVANTVNMTVSDPIIELGSNNLNTNDLGIIMTRHGATNSNIALVYDESDDILRMGYTLNGASDSIISLDSNALSVSVQGALSAASVTTDDYLIHGGDTDTKVGFPSVDTFAVNTAGSERLRVDSSGNVGIGTTNPDLELHVHDANNATSGIILSSTNGYHRIYESSGQLYIQSGTAASADSRADINFTSMYNSTSYMKILGSNGNVGIGTNNPIGKLDVWDGASNGTNIQQNAFIYLRNPANAATNYGAAIVFENTDGAGGTRKGLGRIAALRENNAANYSSYLQFSPTAAGTEFEAMRLTSAGNVGIGTTSPIQTLNVKGNGQNPVIYMTDGTNNRYASGMGTHNVTNVGQRLDFYNGDSGANGTSLSSSHIRMSIDANGKVGIGKTDPGYKLDVLTDTNWDGIILRSSGNLHAYISKDSNGCSFGMNESGNRKVYIRTNAASYFTGGDVGIGTTTPGDILEIYKSGASDNLGMITKNGTRQWRAGVRGDTSSVFAIQDDTAGAMRMVIDSSGNVGIGTTSPNSDLHVQTSSGDCQVLVKAPDNAMAAIKLYGTSQGTGRLYVGQSTAYGGGIEYNGDNSPTTTGAGADYVTLYRVANSSYFWTARNSYGDDDWEFRRYIKHQNPVFYAYTNSGGPSQNSYIVYNSTRLNRGGNFSTSNGIFTCPIGGVYHFTWGAIGSSTSTVYRYRIHINNSALGDIQLRLDTTAPNSAYGDGERTIVLYLNANDTVRIHYKPDNNSTADHGYEYTYFQGYLISL